MNNRVLFVDDDINILQAYKRQLRKQFDLHVAQGAEEGLKCMKEQHEFAVVISDFSMPGMNGVEFLAAAKKHSPNTIRIMLTGYANSTNAINAVNEGSIFRFLSKPCSPEQLSHTLNTALKQYQLVTAEKELLEKTLFGSIKVMSQVLSLVNPLAFSSTSRIKACIKHLVNVLDLPGHWRYELAAMLCQLGRITLPPETTSKILASQPLSDSEQTLFEACPSVTASLLEKIPRLEEVAEMVRKQQCHYHDYRQEDDKLPDDPVLLGAFMLKVSLDLDLLISQNNSLPSAITIMTKRQDTYHPILLQSIRSIEKIERGMEIRLIGVKGVTEYMIADEDIHTTSGLLLVAKGQEISMPSLKRLRSFSQSVGVVEPFRMKVP